MSDVYVLRRQDGGAPTASAPLPRKLWPANAGAADLSAETSILHTSRPAHRFPWSSLGDFKANQFVLVRIALALAVIYTHSFPMIAHGRLTDPLWAINPHFGSGNIAVNMFLAISGFLVTASWDSSRSRGDFLLKRVLRIYPAFVLLSLLQAFVLAPLVTPATFSGYSLKQVGLILAEMVDLVGYGYPYGGLLPVFVDSQFPGEMNGSLWTIRYEFVCYVLLALLGGFRQTRILAVVFLGVMLLYLSGWLPPWNKILTALLGAVPLWPRLLSYFLAGCLFFRLRDKIVHDWRLAAVSFALLVVFFRSDIALRLLMPVAGVYLILWVSYHPKLLRLPNLKNADISYGLYLYAFPIQQSLMLWVAPRWPMTPYVLFLLSTACTAPVAALSWFLVERPFLRLKPRPANDPGRLATN